MSLYGTWLKLMRVTAYVLRAVKLFTTNVSLLKANCRQKKRRRQRLSVVSGYRKKSIKKIGSCLLRVMSTELSVDIAVDTRSTLGR